MKAVLKYPGAKNRLAKWITAYIPEHHVYCEPFLGSGAVFFNKKPCYNEILNDINGDVFIFFKTLRESPDELIRAINLTLYSRAEYDEAHKQNKTDDNVERARKFAVRHWQGFGSGNVYKNGYRRGIGSSSPNPAKAWSKLPETLALAAERIKNAQIECTDAISLIRDLRGDKTFIYVDPPYLKEVRTQKYLYNYEMTDRDHEKLLDALVESDCKILLSGYDNDLYNDKLNGWNKVSTHTTAECSVKRTEILWYNYNSQITFF